MMRQIWSCQVIAPRVDTVLARRSTRTLRTLLVRSVVVLVWHAEVAVLCMCELRWCHCWHWWDWTLDLRHVCLCFVAR